MGIRELQKKQDKALEIYHAENKRLQHEIDALRSKRGTKLKTYAYNTEIRFQEGRDRKPTNGNW